MNKYIKILISLLFLFCLNSYSQARIQYVIASGSKGGNYNKAGKYIAEVYNKNLEHKFTSIQTNGSLGNLELLKNNHADFAIVQRNILLNSLYDGQKGINNIEVIAPLFEEKLLIYTQSSSAISIAEFKKLILKKNYTIGFTSEEGYSFQLFESITKYMEIENSNYKYQFSDYNQLISDFKSKKLDCIVSFSLPIIELDSSNIANLIYFNEEDVSLISDRIPNLFKTKIKSDSQKLTFGSWTFLIGLKDKIIQVESQEKLFYSLQNNKNSSSYFGNIISKSILDFKLNKSWTSKYLNGIPFFSSLEEELVKPKSFLQKNYLYILLILCSFILFNILIYKEIIPKVNYLYLWIRYKHIVFGICILILLYVFSVQILRNSEQVLYDKLGIKSQLLNLSNNELNFWILIRNLTGNDNGIFPSSVNGKLMLSFTSYIVWIGTILIALSEYIAYQFSKKRKKGLMKIKYNNHIVVLGWNETTPKFIIDTIKSANQYNSESRKIACISTISSEKIIENNKELRELHELKKIDFVQGNARDKKTLENSNIHNAHTVILLAENNTKEADERTLLRSLAISKYCREKALLKSDTETSQDIDYKLYETGKYIDSIYIIAEINEPEFKLDLLESDVNEVVITSSYGKSIITQSMLNRGVSKVLDEILQYNEFNEFYIIDLSKKQNSHLQNKTFDELLLPLRKQKILLIAIKIIYHDKNNNIIIDRKIIYENLKNENLFREVIINPVSEKEIIRPTDKDDHLIVFSTNRKDLEKQIKKVIFD